MIIAAEKTKKIPGTGLDKIYTFSGIDGLNTYFFNYDVPTTYFELYLNERKITTYPIPSFITEEFIDQIIEDIINTEIVSRVMEEDGGSFLRGWKMTEQVGIGVINPLGLSKLTLSSKTIKTP